MRKPGRDFRARPRRTERAEFATASSSAFRLHALAFMLGGVALVGADWLTGGPWWSIWPLAVWSAAFTVHYLVVKARTTDERWAEERAADLRSKSYDASHMDSIAERYQVKAPDPPEKPK